MLARANRHAFQSVVAYSPLQAQRNAKSGYYYVSTSVRTSGGREGPRHLRDIKNDSWTIAQQL